MQEFNVRLKPSRVFEVETEDGKALGRFVIDGPVWNGMQCLQRGDGKKLIVVADRGIVGGLATIFESSEPILSPVMSASPELVPAAAKAPPEPLTPEEADRIRELMIREPASPGRDFEQEESDAQSDEEAQRDCRPVTPTSEHQPNRQAAQ